MKAEVEVKVALIVLEDRKAPFTKRIAKDLPVHERRRRQQGDRGEEALQPICKVYGKAIGRTFGEWYYLVNDPVEGLCFENPAIGDEEYKNTVEYRGGWVDDLENDDVPAIILY